MTTSIGPLFRFHTACVCVCVCVCVCMGPSLGFRARVEPRDASGAVAGAEPEVEIYSIDSNCWYITVLGEER